MLINLHQNVADGNKMFALLYSVNLADTVKRERIQVIRSVGKAKHNDNEMGLFVIHIVPLFLRLCVYGGTGTTTNTKC